MNIQRNDFSVKNKANSSLVYTYKGMNVDVVIDVQQNMHIEDYYCDLAPDEVLCECFCNEAQWWDIDLKPIKRSNKHFHESIDLNQLIQWIESWVDRMMESDRNSPEVRENFEQLFGDDPDKIVEVAMEKLLSSTPD